MFEGMTTENDTKILQNHMPNHTQPIGEWFKLFLKIVEDEDMMKELRKSLKATISLEEEEVDRPGEGLPEKASIRVKWNKRRSKKEF